MWWIWLILVVVLGLPIINGLWLVILWLLHRLSMDNFRIYDYIFVHTNALNEDQEPGDDYKARLDKAVELWRVLGGYKPAIVLTGGIHGDDDISLAEAGKRYLWSEGVPDSSIISTPEGIGRNAFGTIGEVIVGKDLMSPDSKFFVVTNRYHAVRVRLLWRFQGRFNFKLVTSDLPPGTDKRVHRKFFISEVILTIYTLYDPYWVLMSKRVRKVMTSK
jgi:hypothetical protein